jgi:hypothetical protein
MNALVAAATRMGKPAEQLACEALDRAGQHARIIAARGR